MTDLILWPSIGWTRCGLTIMNLWRKNKSWTPLTWESSVEVKSRMQRLVRAGRTGKKGEDRKRVKQKPPCLIARRLFWGLTYCFFALIVFLCQIHISLRLNYPGINRENQYHPKDSEEWSKYQAHTYYAKSPYDSQSNNHNFTRCFHFIRSFFSV